jgi:hypothetical protein
MGLWELAALASSSRSLPCPLTWSSPLPGRLMTTTLDRLAHALRIRRSLGRRRGHRSRALVVIALGSCSGGGDVGDPGPNADVPEAPSDLRITQLGDWIWLLSWSADAPGDISGFALDWKEGAGDWASYTLPAEARQDPVYPALPASAVTYRLWSYNDAGRSNSYAEISATTAPPALIVVSDTSLAFARTTSDTTPQGAAVTVTSGNPGSDLWFLSSTVERTNAAEECYWGPCWLLQGLSPAMGTVGGAPATLGIAIPAVTTFRTPGIYTGTVILSSPVASNTVRVTVTVTVTAG